MHEASGMYLMRTYVHHAQGGKLVVKSCLSLVMHLCWCYIQGMELGQITVNYY